MSSNGSYLRGFDRFRLDLAKKVLWYGDEPVHVPGKAVEVLCELVERRGEVVTKDELLDRVWENSFVEESVLTQNIHLLRKTFKDLHIKENPIQTIPRRGYRFAGEVREIESDVVVEHEIVERDYLTEISEDSLKNIAAGSTASSSPRGLRLPSITALLILVGVVGLSVWWYAASAENVTRNDIQSIAVLPLRSLNKAEPNSDLSLGLTDSIITRLASLNSFAVRPFSAIEKFGDSGKDAVEFGRQLRADSVLEGTIQRSEDRVRVSLRVIDVRDGTPVWADSFEEASGDVLKLQDAISNRVARALVSKLRPRDEELLAKKPTENPEAYWLYLAGRESWLQRNGKTESLAFYRKAIEMDPNFALPYLGIADEYAFSYETKTAEDALAKAIELDPTLAEAHATRGFLRMFHHWDWQGAEASFLRAIELAPHSSKAHHWYGVYLSIRGRFDEAQREMEKALELDPTALVIMSDIAELHYFKRNYELAEADLQKVLAADPGFINARLNLVKVRFKRGGSYFLDEAAFNVFLQKKRKAEGLAQDYDPTELEQIVAKGDERTLRDNARKAIEKAAHNKPENYLGLSRFYAIAGEKERSLSALEKAVAAKPFVIPFVAVDPLWDPIRGEPRFQEIIRKMNL